MAAVLVLLILLITLCGRHEDEAADCAVIPGHRLTRKGEPSRSMLARTRHAINLYETQRVRTLVFTGGRTRGQLTEAWAGAQLALAAGVPEEHILLETSSRTTWENLKAARTLLEGRTALIVTDPYHLLRCRLIARQVGLKAGSAPVPEAPSGKLPWILYYTLGECGSLTLYALGRATGWYRNSR